MEFQFSFGLLEAACLICECDYGDVVALMAKNDHDAAKIKMDSELRLCDACFRNDLLCPQWTSSCPEDAKLICPERFSSPPIGDIQRYLPRARAVPNDGEASKELLEVVQTLIQALLTGHLKGSQDQIIRKDLLGFLLEFFPDVKPAALFDVPTSAVGYSKAEIVLGALLTYLDKQRYFKLEVAKLAISEAVPGRGFGKRTLENVFADAKVSFANAGGGVKKLL